MKTSSSLILIAWLAGSPDSALAGDYPVSPVIFTRVRIDDGFWTRRLEVNRTVTIPFAFQMCERTGRVDNFAIAAGLKTGEQRGAYPFDDSDVYKVIEGASYSLAVFPDASLEHYLDSLIAIVAGAQEKDGYIYTARTNKSKRLATAIGPERWTNLRWSHELYDAGHLYEAAVAFYQATGKRSLLDVALKNADLISRTFGPEGLHIPSGHQEIEIGLAKLYRITGDWKYIDLAKFLLDQRGRVTGGRPSFEEYAQDHIPVTEQPEAVGHAVRELYMLSGMADVAALTGDSSYVRAVDRLWRDIVERKMYVTGGVGATGMWEGFGPAYDLPNLSAYCETCASIANALFNYRMFILHPEGKYIDVLERTLYNALLSGVSMSGDKFFYPNVLGSRGQSQRSPWFECACCPSNITRFIPSVAGYVYATRGDSLYVNLYVGNHATVDMRGRKIAVAEKTDYPWDGTVSITVDPERKGSFTVLLRIPGWARNEATPGGLYSFVDTAASPVQLQVNGDPQRLRMEKGYVMLNRSWKKGDVIRLTLPMPVRRIAADPRVMADAGRVALQRGPLVYCAEGTDNSGGHVLNLCLADRTTLQTQARSELLNGVNIIAGKAGATRYDAGKKLTVSEPVEFTAIPYYAWSHRGPGEMQVWIPRNESGTEPFDGPSIASKARATSSGGVGLEYLNQQRDAESGAQDDRRDVFQWTPRTDTVWVEYAFPEPKELSEVRVFWHDDGKLCRVPKSWRVLARAEGEWYPVYNASKLWGVELNKFNGVVFETVRTQQLRIEAVPQPGSSAGIVEWRVY